jgi:hypothetical protein
MKRCEFQILFSGNFIIFYEICLLKVIHSPTQRSRTLVEVLLCWVFRISECVGFVVFRFNESRSMGLLCIELFVKKPHSGQIIRSETHLNINNGRKLL